MRRRTLRLTRETLTELTPRDLAAVAGAAPDGTVACALTAWVERLTGPLSGACFTYACPDEGR